MAHSLTAHTLKTSLQPSTTVTASGTGTRDLDVASVWEMAVFLDVTAISGAGASLTAHIQAQSFDGGWATIASFAAATAIGTSVLTLSSCQGSAFGDTIRIVWDVAGTTPSITFSASVKGK